MKKLETYYKNGYDFTVIVRHGDLAIAKGISRQTGRDNWEVFEVQSHNGVQMGDNWVPAAEFVPSNTQWGDKGWTALNEQHANEILTKKINERAN
jgi:hypothetical protein